MADHPFDREYLDALDAAAGLLARRFPELALRLFRLRRFLAAATPGERARAAVRTLLELYPELARDLVRD